MLPPLLPLARSARQLTSAVPKGAPLADASLATGHQVGGEDPDDPEEHEESDPEDPDDEPEEPEITPPLEQWQRQVGELYIEGFKHYAVESADPDIEMGYVRHRSYDGSTQWCVLVRHMQQGGTTDYTRDELPEGSTLRYHIDENDKAYWLVADEDEGHDDTPDGHNLLRESDRPDFRRSVIPRSPSFLFLFGGVSRNMLRSRLRLLLERHPRAQRPRRRGRVAAGGPPRRGAGPGGVHAARL